MTAAEKYVAAAYLLLAGFALVITVRLGLPAAHFS